MSFKISKSSKRKTVKPTEIDLKDALGSTFSIWQLIRDFTKLLYPTAIEEWSFSGDKFGWSFRLKDKKRVLVYLLPRDSFFKVALVFGQNATDKILESNICSIFIYQRYSLYFFFIIIFTLLIYLIFFK